MMTKVYYLTSTDDHGEHHDLDYMARANNPERVIAVWQAESGGNPVGVVAHEASAADIAAFRESVGEVEDVETLT